MMNPRHGICFVSHSAYAAMIGKTDGQIGGIERQQALMAKWLARRGHHVSMLTWDEGGPAEETIDGVRVIKICGQGAGLPGLRFFHPKWTHLNRAMRQADAAVYYQNCGECFTGQAAMWCRRNNRKFIFSVASDADCDPARLAMGSFIERWLYRRGLQLADTVIAQTKSQQAMLSKWFGRDSQVIPMPCESPADDDFQRTGDRILWIGRVCPVKRPDRLLAVAKACPELHFDMVGPPGLEDYVRQVLAEATTIANLRVHGPVSFARVGRYYGQSSLLLNTSEYEGFPNTFLEAWSRGLPAVSTFDPDGLISQRKLGLIARSDTDLAQAIRLLLQDKDFYRTCSRNAREYFLANHPVEVTMPKFEAAICQ